MTTRPPRIQSAAVQIILRVPEFAPFLSLPIQEGKVEGGYAQVDQNLNILISPTVPDNLLPGILLHEFLHVALQHFQRARNLSPLDPTIFNIATDAIINCIVSALGFKLPEDCVDPKVVADFLGVRSEELVNLGTEEVYRRLLQQAQQQQNHHALQQSPHDNHRPFFQPSSSQQQQQTSSSSSSSQQQQSQQQSQHSPQSKRSSRRSSRKSSPQSSNSSQQQSQQSQQPQQPQQPQQSLTEEDFANIAISILPPVLRRHGLSPAGIVRDWIRNRHGSINWRSLLYNVFASLQQQYVFPHRKLLPFRLSFPQPVPAHPYLLIAIDASGSISHEELSVFVSEIDALQQQFPSRIDLISFDAQVYPLCELSPHQPIPADLKIQGGGGTDFRPVADYVLELQPQPDAVIVLTDGFGEYPPREHPALKETKWVWVLTPNHKRPPAHVGEWAILEGGETP